MVWHLHLLSSEHNNWQPGTCMELTTAAQHPIWGKIQLTITRKEKKSDIPQRTSPEAAESTDSATNLTNTQPQGDTIGNGSPRHCRLEAGATPPTVTPLADIWFLFFHETDYIIIICIYTRGVLSTCTSYSNQSFKLCSNLRHTITWTKCKDKSPVHQSNRQKQSYILGSLAVNSCFQHFTGTCNFYHKFLPT